MQDRLRLIASRPEKSLCGFEVRHDFLEIKRSSHCARRWPIAASSCEPWKSAPKPLRRIWVEQVALAFLGLELFGFGKRRLLFGNVRPLGGEVGVELGVLRPLCREIGLRKNGFGRAD